NVTVQGFTLTEGSAANLRIVDSSDVLVTKVTSRLGSGFGIDVSGGSGVRLEKNAVFGPALDCIEMDSGSGGVVLGNKITSCGGNGIDVTSPDARVEKNKIILADGDGLTLRGGEVAQKNKIDAAGDDGITTSGAATVVQNKVSSPGEDGIQVDGNGGRYASNKVSNAGNDCVQITGTGNLFESNKIAGCEDGFEIEGNSNDFTGNKAQKTTDSGFAVGSNGNEFTGNQAKSLEDGFFVSGSGNVFTSNKSSSRDEDLRDLNPNDGTNTYVDNRFPTEAFGPLP
ncbi:MAG: right-handed parallel beta-helix repeat-containing protein, partial [Myxococcota bacterium]